MAREFVVWMESPPCTWIRLPRSFAEELPAGGPVGLWLQPDGCCNWSSWTEVEVTPSGYVYLTRGWQSFFHARGLKGRHTLHFKYDGATTLFVKIFGKDGGRLGCCPESDSSGGDHPCSNDDDRRSGDILGGKLALGNGRDASSSEDASSGGARAMMTMTSRHAAASRRRRRTPTERRRRRGRCLRSCGLR
jgi:hypothetical protein